MSQPKRYRPVIVRGEPKFVQDETGDFTTLSEYYLQRDRADRIEGRVSSLAADNATLNAKVEWLMKADKLVIWDGQEWRVRHGVLPTGKGDAK